MSLGPEYLQYPKRRRGMDHDHYDWSMLSERPPVHWPEGKKLALWVNVPLQFFPLNQAGTPFPPLGGMTMPYPDLRHYTLRDYGNRVGIYRFLKVFDRYAVKATYAINARLADRTPYLMRILAERGEEIIGHGLHMDAPHYGGMEWAAEESQVERSLDTLRAVFDRDIAGWLSPGRSESENTPELLVKHGIRYFCDWVNDDMPYQFRTNKGSLWAMPLSNELDDVFILMNNLHAESSYVDQICDACDYLIEEAKQQGGRILALNIHPWMLGQPHRIGKLEQVLEYLTGKDEVWSAGASEILDCAKPQINGSSQ